MSDSINEYIKESNRHAAKLKAEEEFAKTPIGQLEAKDDKELANWLYELGNDGPHLSWATYEWNRRLTRVTAKATWKATVWGMAIGSILTTVVGYVLLKMFGE